MIPTTSKETRRGPCTVYKQALLCIILIVAVTTYVTLWSSNGMFSYLYHSSRTKTHQPSTFMFIETAGHTTLNVRQACAVESASLHHPDFTIQFFVTAQPSQDCAYCSILRRIPNIKIKFLDVNEAVLGTPLESWYNSDKRHESPYAVSHLSDALRFLLLWRYGGIYADTDVIVKRSMSNLRNTLAKEYAGGMGSAVLIFDSGQPFLADAIKTFAETYQPHLWDFNGPGLLGRMLEKRCPGAWNVADAPLTCGDISVLSSRSFFAVPWRTWEFIFNISNTKDVMKAVNDSYVVHFWNKLSKNTKVVVGSAVAYDLLAKANCPKVYDAVKAVGYF